MMTSAQMIEVNTTQGWMDYCQVEIETDLVDMNGVSLKTGDVVEILDGDYHRCGFDGCRTGTGMVIFDQYDRFLVGTKFFVEGWLSVDWANERKWLIRKVDRVQHDPSHYRIAKPIVND